MDGSWVLLLLLCGTVHGGATNTSYAESFDSKLQTEHQALISVFSCVVFFAGASVIGLVAVRRAGLSWVFGVSLGATVLLAGVVAWVVTYEQMKVEIEHHVEDLIYSIGSDVQSRVQSEMEAAAKISQLHKSTADTGAVDVLSKDVEQHMWHLQRVWSQYYEYRRSITFFYYANALDDTYGIYNDFDLWIVSAPPGRYPASWQCYHDSPYTDCASHTCGVAGNELFDAQNCSETCNRPSNAICDGTILNMTGKVGYGPSASAPNVGNLAMSDPVTLKTNAYSSQSRPWYNKSKVDTVTWLDPYVFSDRSIGISAVVGTRNPTTGVWESVAATDFKTQSLRGFVTPLKPTSGSNILVINKAGTVITGSHNLNDISNATEGSVLSAWEAPAPSVAQPMRAIERRFGRSIPVEETSLIHEGEVVILVQPLVIEGNMTLYIVVSIPYADVLQKAWDASTVALAIVLSLSVGLSLLMAMVFTLMLRPLSVLDSAMQDVAWMRLDSAPKVSSRVTEIASMAASFTKMVDNLTLYKQYLPQSLLAAQEDQESEGTDDTRSSFHGNRGESASVGSHSSWRTGTRVNAAELFSTKMEPKEVTVVSLNMKDTHNQIRDSNFKYLMASFLQVVQGACKETRGVVDNISGDRVRVTFNAVTLSAGHRLKACMCACIIKSKHAPGVTAGVSTGKASVGNVGCSGMMKHSVFGVVVGESVLLEGLAKQVKEGVVAAEVTAAEVETHFETKKLYKVQLRDKAVMVRSILWRRKDKNEEWMYAIESANKEGYGAYNEAVAAVLLGRPEEAVKKLETSNVTEDEKQQLRRRIEAVQGGARELPLLMPMWRLPSSIEVVSDVI